MPRVIDHIVIASRRLDEAAARYRQLGFQVGPRNRHPWGTENHIVQFGGAFLELVGLGEGFLKPAPEDPVFPFAGFLADFLARREGLAMVAMRSNDADADARDFAAAGFGAGRFDFSRKARRQGRETEVAFSLAFARAAALPETGFFVSHHRFPENFWDPAAQVHSNNATAVAELAIAHADPADVSGFLAAFLDATPEPTPAGVDFALAGTRVTCATPKSLTPRLGAPPPAGLAAVRVARRDGSSFWLA